VALALVRLRLREASDAVRREDKDSRPADTETLIFSEAGPGNYQPGPVARGHKNQVSSVSAHVPSAIAYLKAATHCETYPPGDRTPPDPNGANHKSETHQDE
jgi:hypothetical protein